MWPPWNGSFSATGTLNSRSRAPASAVSQPAGHVAPRAFAQAYLRPPHTWVGPDRWPDIGPSNGPPKASAYMTVKPFSDIFGATSRQVRNGPPRMAQVCLLV